ncbi:MAG: hypothetical protein ACI81P_001315 [Neolewinella sp.]|jgi:hypothetical protein
MKHLFTLLVMLVMFTSCNQEERLQNAIDGIGEADAFMSDAVGFAGMKPDAYKHYETVRKLASPDQLQQLINDDRPTVRIYGFQGMVETNHSETFTAFRTLVADSTSLSTMRGCLMGSERLNFLAANLLGNDGLKREHYQFKGRERTVFDSLLLFSGYFPMRAWTSSLKTVAPVDQHYEPIKKLAHDSASITARTGLANFQREIDLDFFRSGFSMNKEHRYNNTMDIISRFPHTSFLPFLKKLQRKLLDAGVLSYDFDILYLAIFQYPTEDIKPFLEVLDRHSDEVRDAV